VTPSAQELALALAEPDPVSALRRIVQERLVIDGYSRQTVLADLKDLREELEAAGQSEQEELVMTVMDHFVGWSAPYWSMILLGTDESDEDFEPVPDTK
jgi:hypothetical protein